MRNWKIRCLFALAVTLVPFQVARSQDRSIQSQLGDISTDLALQVSCPCDDSHDDWLSDQLIDHDAGDVRGSFLDEIFAPADHRHFTRRGTPLVHLFLVEPAVLHRDIFLDYRIGNNVDRNTDEQELEIEIEWALTRRLGLIIEAPYLGLNPDTDPNTSGFGDFAVAGRALLVDGETFFMSANLAVGIPTGSVSRGLGGGEVTIAPSVTTWHDLGNWTALHTQFGTEVGTQSGDTELIYGLALTHSFQGPVLFPFLDRADNGHDHHGHDDHGHDHGQSFQPGFTSFILEMTGASGLSGADSDQAFFELLPGISYTPVDRMELRFGVRVPLFKPTRLDSQYIFTIARVF